jgi:hypothetical protein
MSAPAALRLAVGDGFFAANGLRHLPGAEPGIQQGAGAACSGSGSAEMRMKSIARNRDVLAGLLLIVIGGAAIFIARSYHLGTAAQMGPGFFPLLLGAAIIVTGICLILQRGTESIDLDISALRPLVCVVGAPVVFALLVDRLGFVISAAAAVFLSCLSQPGFRLREVVLSAAVLVTGAVVLFLWLLKVPIEMWPV